MHTKIELSEFHYEEFSHNHRNDLIVMHALREADAILREEFDKNGLAEKVWQYFIAIPDIKSVGVKDESRYEGWPAIIRAVNT